MFGRGPLDQPGITAGAGIRVARGARIEAWPGSELVFGDGCEIGPDSRVVANGGGRVELAAGVVLGTGCAVIAHDLVRIGTRTVLEDGVVVLDFDHDIADVETPIRRQGLLMAPVHIGPDARIGVRACVLRGVTVGAGAVVGPHAVVTRDVPAGCSVEGIPARLSLSSDP